MMSDGLLGDRRVGYSLSCEVTRVTEKFGRAAWLPPKADQVVMLAVGHTLYLIALDLNATSVLPVASVRLDFTDHVRACSMHSSGRLLAVSLQSKAFLIFDLDCPCPTEQSSTTGVAFKCCYENKLSKKLTKVQWEGEFSVLCADKFGTFLLYCFQQTGASEVPAALVLCSDSPKVPLGHYSTITEFLLIASSPANRRAEADVLRSDRWLISADKDEKIRVSRWPHAYDIESFCLGHTQFVSALCLIQNDDGLDVLLSAGGDGRLIAWDYLRGQVLADSDLSQITAELLSESSSALRRHYAVTETIATKIVCVEKKWIVISVELLDYLLFYSLSGNNKLCRLNYLNNCSIPMIPTGLVVDSQSRLWISGLPNHPHSRPPLLVASVSVNSDGFPRLIFDDEGVDRIAEKCTFDASPESSSAETTLNLLLMEKDFKKRVSGTRADPTDQTLSKRRPPSSIIIPT